LWVFGCWFWVWELEVRDWDGLVVLERLLAEGSLFS